MAGIVLGARVPTILTQPRRILRKPGSPVCAVAVLLHYAEHPVEKADSQPNPQARMGVISSGTAPVSFGSAVNPGESLSSRWHPIACTE